MKKSSWTVAAFLLASALPVCAAIVLQSTDERYRLDVPQHRSVMSGIIMVPGYAPSGLRSPQVARSVQRAGAWSGGGNGCCAMDGVGIPVMELEWVSRDRPSLARANALRARSFAGR